VKIAQGISKLGDGGLIAGLVLTLLSTAPAEGAGVFNVRDFGAKGDGKTLETAALQKAIAACAADGGGQVLLPPGKYLSATIRLKSHVTFKLDAGAVLIGCPDPDAYDHFSAPRDMPEAKFPTRWHRALIIGDDVEDVAIVGPGTINGNKVFDPHGEEKRRGPHTILFGSARDIVIRDLTIQDSANYALMLEDCSRVDIRQVKVTGGWDGLHFRGSKDRPCRDVTVSGCQFFTGDDAIAGRYWERVLITGCVLNSSCNAVRLIGPARDLIVHDCLIFGPGRHAQPTSERRKTLAGISLQPGAWDATEGDLDDVLLSQITMRNVAVPFFFMLRKGNKGGNITVSHVHATGVHLGASSVESWADSPFERVVFRDVSIEFEGGGNREHVKKSIKAPHVDPRPLPCWGFFARGVKDLRFENVRLSTTHDDKRPMLLAEEIGTLTLDAVRFPCVDKVAPFILTDVAKLRTRDADWEVLSPRCVRLQFKPTGETERILVNKPFSAAVTVENGPKAGLGKIELELARKTWTRWEWLEPGQRRQVTFPAVTVTAPGVYHGTAGELMEKVTVEKGA
jgi:hypothetical protein